MLISQQPSSTFYAFDKLKVYKNDKGVSFIALKNNEIKRVDKFPVDITVEESTKEDFIEALNGSSINTAMSHLLRDGLLDELK